MALDRQKILNELGSVVSQLQRADCGCMGKLFSPPSNQVNSYPTPQNKCAHNSQGCCRGSCNSFSSPCAGEPCPGVRNCMGFCNPPKLYADTYKYLSHNLMQPVVREVYNDLKSISPANTIMNNPMAAQMGLQSKNPDQGNTMAQHSSPGGAMGNPNGMSPHMHGHTDHITTGRFAEMNANNQNYRQGMGHMGHVMGQMDQGMGEMGHETTKMGHEMGHMGQGMGHMNQEGDHVAQEMGHMGHGTGHTGHGMAHMGHGMAHMGHGMGHMGHGMGYMGQGMDHMAHEAGHMGHEAGHMGHEAGHMGHEAGRMVHGVDHQRHGMDHMGHGVDHMGHGVDHMGHGMGHMGHGMGHMGHEAGRMGHEAGRMGHEAGHMDHEAGHMGHGAGHIGHGAGHMGHGAGHMGLEAGRMGHEAGHMGHEAGHMGHGTGHMGHGTGHMGHGTGHMGHGMGHMGHGMAQMGQDKMGQGMLAGMGPQIVNMMRSSANPNAMPNQGVTPTNDTNNMQHSPEMGQMGSSIPVDQHEGKYDSGYMPNNAGYMEMNRMRQRDPGMQTTQYMPQPNMFPGATANAQGNATPGNMKSNPTTQGMGNMNAAPNAHQMNNANRYGRHSTGMAKFNEMFPGVIKGDLGFDPMAIAIQMNPANSQKSAMDTMQKMMMNNAGIGKIVDGSSNVSSKLQPVINAAHAASASIVQPNESVNQGPGQQNMVPAPPQQRQPGEMAGGAEMQNNQAYSTLTGAPTMNQQPTQQTATQEQLQHQQWQIQQKLQQQSDQTHKPSHQPPQQQMMDPNTEAVVSGALPTVFEGDPNNAQQLRPRQTPKDMYREPIFPADTTRNLLHSHHFTKPQRFLDYNTLGQPVEMLSAKQYQIPIPSLPQTLSPQPAPVRYSNVKNTVSKTSLMGNKPVGKTPSRSQLQQVYNNYKGSHSYTQQNIRPTARNGSFSEGRINVPQANHAHHNYHHEHQTPIEVVGGDTAANNYIMDQIGNARADKKQPNDLATSSARNLKLRNGLQDQVFTSAPTSAKWSFHGTAPVPFSVGYRIRNKFH